MLARLTAAEKSYKRDTRATTVSPAAEELRRAIGHYFRALIGARGPHVREFRYDNQRIEPLELIEPLSHSPDKQFVNAIRCLRRFATQDTPAAEASGSRLEQGRRDSR